MTSIKKLKRTATVMACIVGLVIMYVLVHGVAMYALGWGRSEYVSWTLIAIVTIVTSWAILLSTLAISLSLLLTVIRDETPFNRRSVKCLKILAILLVVIEPFNYVASRLTRANFLAFMGYEDSLETMVSVHISFGGFILVAGLVVYCVALIFDYGITLQKQVDETL